MSVSTGRRIRKRKLKAEINVVPYIDVMLVLLIIFMITAPLLNLGVDIELPKSNAKTIAQDKDPVIVSVDADGNYFLTLQGAEQEEVSREAIAGEAREREQEAKRRQEQIDLTERKRQDEAERKQRLPGIGAGFPHCCTASDGALINPTRGTPAFCNSTIACRTTS